jgi:hypothetical protein
MHLDTGGMDASLYHSGDIYGVSPHQAWPRYLAWLAINVNRHTQAKWPIYSVIKRKFVKQRYKQQNDYDYFTKGVNSITTIVY